jgi:MFS family permease
MQKGLQSNIWKYAVYLVTMRRIYWPLLTVFFLTFPDNTAQQIGIFLGIGHLFGFIFELPSGYLSDKIGHKKALIIARLCWLISTGLFLWGENFYIFTLGSITLSIAFAFNSGTITAFMHETLIGLNKDHLYSKIIGRIHSRTLILSAIILAILPFTVAINIRLPFAIALIFDLIGLLITFSFVIPINKQTGIEEVKPQNFKEVIKEGKDLGVYPIMILIASISAVIMSSAAYRDVYQQWLGISIVHLGIFFASSRLVASLISHNAHNIYINFNAKQFLGFLVLFYSMIIILMGYTHNKWFVAIGFVVIVGSWHGISPVFDHYKLEYIKTSKFKATLLSVGGLVRALIIVATHSIIAFFIGRYLYAAGFLYFGIAGLILMILTYSIFIIYGQKAQQK